MRAGQHKLRNLCLLLLPSLLSGCGQLTSHVIGPFNTIQEAQTAVRATHGLDPKHPLIVQVNGTTALSGPLVFDATDSGTPASPISYVAVNHSAVTGGKLLAGWYHVNGSVWAANVGALRFRQLFINGKRMTPARTPNQGYFQVDGTPDYHNPVRFKFRNGQMSERWVGGQVVLLQTWGEERLPITAVDPATSTVTLANQLLPWTVEANARFWVEDVAEFLDSPGEWFLDRNAGIVYYWAKPGEDVSSDEIIAPVTQTLLVLNGVHDVSFLGFDFEYSDWALPSEGYYDLQSAYDIPAAIMGHGASSVTISDSHFSHLGTWAVNLDSGSSNNTVSNNEMTDIGAGGVKIGEFCSDTVANPNAALSGFQNCVWTQPFSNGNKISNNTIHDIGAVYIAAVGVWLGQTYGNSVCSNEIYDTNQTAISLGWTWGYGRSLAHDNLIAFNNLHTLGRGMLSDMGGIYTLGSQPGTVIRNNIIHDITPYAQGYGGWGIYQDQGSSNILTENNIVYRAPSGAFVHNAEGSGNRTLNNVFASLDNGPILYMTPTLPPSAPSSGYNVLFERNILFGNGGVSGFGVLQPYFKFDGNLYFDVGYPQTITDANATVADPQFVAPLSGNFSLGPSSPAYKIGFQPIQTVPSDGVCQ